MTDDGWKLKPKFILDVFSFFVSLLEKVCKKFVFSPFIRIFVANKPT